MASLLHIETFAQSSVGGQLGTKLNFKNIVFILFFKYCLYTQMLLKSHKDFTVAAFRYPERTVYTTYYIPYIVLLVWWSCHTRLWQKILFSFLKKKTFIKAARKKNLICCKTLSRSINLYNLNDHDFPPVWGKKSTELSRLKHLL